MVTLIFWVGTALFVVTLAICTVRLSKQIAPKLRDLLAWVVILAMFYGFFYGVMIHLKEAKNIRIQDLKGQNPYEIQVKETYIDGRLEKTDTLYVRKKLKK